MHAVTAPLSTPHPANPRPDPAARPHTTRGSHLPRLAGRGPRGKEGKKEMKMVAPVLSDDGWKVTTIRQTNVLDGSETDERTRRESRAAPSHGAMPAGKIPAGAPCATLWHH